MRYITAAVQQDLQKKMVFIGGPRQVGKTTLAKKLLSTINGRYFNLLTAFPKPSADSLLGRYHYWRLHPFSLDESPIDLNQYEVFDRLMTLGGFPEPFVSGDLRESRRWRRECFDRVLREDIRDLESIKPKNGN